MLLYIHIKFPFYNLTNYMIDLIKLTKNQYMEKTILKINTIELIVNQINKSFFTKKNKYLSIMSGHKYLHKLKNSRLFQN